MGARRTRRRARDALSFDYYMYYRTRTSFSLTRGVSIIEKIT
jgi:hypothetical protein